MDVLTNNWAWWLAALGLAAGSTRVTQQVELRPHRLRLIVSVLLMEYFVWVASYVSLLAGSILFIVTLRYMVVAISHVLSQKMADKATDSLFGDREPSPPSLELKTIRHLRSRGQYHEAIQHLQTVLQATPDEFESRLLLATIYAEDLRDLLRAEEEIGFLQTFVTITPSHKEMAKQKFKAWREMAYARARPLDDEAVRPAGFAHTYTAPVKAKPVMQPESGNRSRVSSASLNKGMPPSYQAIEDLCATGNYGSAVAMVESILAGQPEDLKAWAIKASIYVRYLKQPSLADNALRKILGALDIQPENVDALGKLAEDFTRTKDDRMKAGRIWRKLLEAPSVTVEQKIVLQARLKEWETVSVS